MYYFKIGTNIYRPQSLIFARNVTWTDNSGRNQLHEWVGDLLPDKTSISVGWSTLSENDMQRLLDDTSDAFFDITYIDAQTKGLKTMTIYRPTIKWSTRTYTKKGVMYKDISFEAVEK